MDILDEVKQVVQSRQKDYKSFPDAMQDTAAIFNQITGRDLTGTEIAMIYAINKLVRCRGRLKKDNVLDAIAYLAVIDEMEKGGKTYEG